MFSIDIIKIVQFLLILTYKTRPRQKGIIANLAFQVLRIFFGMQKRKGDSEENGISKVIKKVAEIQHHHKKKRNAKIPIATKNNPISICRLPEGGNASVESSLRIKIS